MFVFKKTPNVFDLKDLLQVRIQRDGKITSKTFPRTEKGYASAVNWRDQTKARVGERKRVITHLHTDKMKEASWKAASRTGVKGVGITNKIDGRSKERKWAVTAHIRKGNRWIVKTFDIKKHTLRGAVTMAVNTLWVDNGDGLAPMVRDQALRNIRRVIKSHE